MGRIAPGKNKNPLFSWPGWSEFKWKWPRRQLPDDNSEATGQSMLRLLKKLWVMPEQFHWMRPLPMLHRRSILILTFIVLLAILWPYSPDDNSSAPVNDANRTKPDVVMQAELTDNHPASAAAPPVSNMGQQHLFRIAEGQTLAQLFRQHDLPVADVFAMAQAEGDDKPLSNLHAGQQVSIAQNAQGIVVELDIETATNGRIRFIRQSDGSYVRQ